MKFSDSRWLVLLCAGWLTACGGSDTSGTDGGGTDSYVPPADTGVDAGDPNECALGTDNCDANATCTDTLGGFTCACNAGYSGNGVTCTDTDECALGTDNCDTNAACTNTAASFTCACNAGFTGNGISCTDTNECLTFPCGAGGAGCTNTPGSYTCGCSSGYVFDGTTCVVSDRCLANNPCDSNATCFEGGGTSVVCTCVSGYTGSGLVCSDVNECATNADNCSNDATCTNTAGSFTCTCNGGFTGNGVTCTDVDECATNNGNCGNPTFYTCTNNVGQGPTCTDVDECATNNGGCSTSPMVTCTNNAGSVATCGSCPSGYTGNGIGANGCTDINECAGPNACTAAYPCQNLVPNYTCRGQFPDWTVSPSPTFTDNGDGTVTDPRNSLVWQQVGPTTGSDWAAAIAYCDGLSLAGATDWRTPTRTELLSLVDLARANPAIDPTVFPNTPQGAHWASDPFRDAGGDSWTVIFADGSSSYTWSTDVSPVVRCVRGGLPASGSGGTSGAPPGRYAYPAAGVVRDTRTQLTWQRQVAPAMYTWAGAAAYCAGLTLDGGGWRLPGRLELESIVDGTTAVPAIDPTAFPSTPTDNYTWSATANVAGGAWSVYFRSGYSPVAAITTSLYVRCVR